MQTPDHEGGQLTGRASRELRQTLALGLWAGINARGKSKAINSPGYVNSHWWVQIGRDQQPLGLMGSGDFVAPQYSIDSLNLYDSLEGTTSHRSSVNQFQPQIYKAAEKRGEKKKKESSTLALNYTNQFLDKMFRLPEKSTGD